MLNSRSLADLRADVRANCETFLAECKKAGLNVLVTQTLRDDEYQATLYKQGYAKTAKVSFHGKGLAFDICKNVKGHEYDDAAFFTKCAAIGKKIGFSWGGDWKSFPDRPHFQWDDGGKVSSANVRAGKLPRTMPAYSAGPDYRAQLKARAGLTDGTMDYLAAYQYGADLIRKLATMK